MSKDKVIELTKGWVYGLLNKGEAIDDGDNSEYLDKIETLCKEYLTSDEFDEIDIADLGEEIREQMTDVEIIRTNRETDHTPRTDEIWLGYKGREYVLFGEVDDYTVKEVGPVYSEIEKDVKWWLENELSTGYCITEKEDESKVIVEIERIFKDRIPNVEGYEEFYHGIEAASMEDSLYTEEGGFFRERVDPQNGGPRFFVGSRKKEYVTVESDEFGEIQMKEFTGTY